MTTQTYKITRTYPVHQFQNWISQTEELIQTLGGLAFLNPFSTRTDAQRARIPPIVNEISVLTGNKQRVLNYVRNTTGIAVKTSLTTADGSIWMADGFTSPDHHGWVSTMTSEQATVVTIAALVSGIKHVKFFEENLYIVDYADATLAGPIHVEILGTVKGSDSAAFLSLPVMRLISPRADRYPVTVSGPGTLDATLRPNIPAVSSGEGLIVRYSDHVLINNGLYFYSGDSKTSGFGDSGFAPWGCKKVVVDGCFFKGWNDHCIYATGGASTDPDRAAEELTITNCNFQECGAGDIRLARNYQRIVCTNNISVNSYRHIIVSGGTPPDELTAYMLNISDNIIFSCEAVAIDIRYTNINTGSCISNNQIYDWALSVPNSAAILLLGASNVACFGNVIIPRFSTIANVTACSQGIYMNNGTDPAGTLFLASNNNVYGNRITVFERSTASTNSCITDITRTAQIYGNFLNNSPYDVWIDTAGVNTVSGYPRAVRTNTLGFGFGGVNPKVQLDVAGILNVTRTDLATRIMEVSCQSTSHEIRSYSPPTLARDIAITSTTDAVNTAPSGGALGIRLRILNTTAFSIDANNRLAATVAGVPDFADDAAAAAGGIVLGGFYRTASVLKIRVA